MPPSVRGFRVTSSPGRQLATATSGVRPSVPMATALFFITRAGMGFCVRPNRYALALATGSAVGADVFALHECDNPVCVKVSEAGALCEHVVAGTQFDNMRRMARARRGGGRPTIRGLGREARRARSVALREAVQAACGMPMRSPMRCSAWNRVCSEAHSGRASFEGGDEASLSSLANPKTEVARGPCRARRDGG